ncbi:alginate lyase family protein [Acidomonas methanolica]|uniref:alginate lyase family protein n=5 Tax=Acidomonas methanolica TaxID=437 RepID=UPI001FB854F1|nr:alginate lyase family protein [Acidomonas methanolica]
MSFRRVATIGLAASLCTCGFPKARAETPWCPVPPSPAAAALPSILHSLDAARERPPAPLSRLHTEGTLPHQGIYDESIAAKRDLLLMRDAALAWRAGAGNEWLDFVRRYLMAWVATYRPSFNPIDETGFDALIDTYAIIGRSLPPDKRARVREYLHAWATGYIEAIGHHNTQPTWTNNWQSHRVKLVTMMAVALDDTLLFDAARTLFRAQIAANIAPDGETLDFRERDALHYVVYDLQPMVQAALAARTRGEDWYRWTADDGASLANAKAMAWLLPYASGEKTHEEFVRSTVRFDAIRAQAGLKGYSGPFDPRGAGTLLWLASELDPSLHPLAERLMPRPPPVVILCGQ